MKPIIDLLLGFVLLVTFHITAWAESTVPETVPQNLQLHIGAINSITRHNITWSFAAPVPYGQFANGDYWVVGPVTITGITPSSVNQAGRIINGSMINPDPNENYLQGYDSAMTYNGYSTALNVAYGINKENPLVVPINSSLISTISHTTPGNTPQLQSASVLTVLPSAPPANSFRPPFAGTNKTIHHKESEINYSALGSIVPTASAPSISTIADRFAKVWLDYRGSANGRMIHPIDNMPNYGRDMSTLSGEAALLLNCNFSNADKRDLLVNYLQWGIDLWGVIQAGFEGWWQDGGQGGGRKFPILFAGVVLGDTSMTNVGLLPYNKPVFGEDQTTYYLTEYEATRWIGTDGKYPTNNLSRDIPEAYYSADDWNYVNSNGERGIPEYGKWLGTGYQGRWISKQIGASYRQCCHANSFTGWALSVHIMGLKKAWNHDALFDYIDRYLKWSEELNADYWYRHNSTFAGEMWEKYRIKYK
jgi:hypothetical protein